MINEKNVKRYCCEDLSLIENYEEAIKSSEIWDCHHRDEILPDGTVQSLSFLINIGQYYKVPANKLIFYSHSYHSKLHSSNISDETRQKMSDRNAEKNGFYGKHHSEESIQKMKDSHKKILKQEAQKTIGYMANIYLKRPKENLVKRTLAKNVQMNQ